MRGGTWCSLALLGAAGRCSWVLGGAWWCFMVLAVLGGAGGAWWCMAVQRVWFVPLGAAWRCLVMPGGAWWCLDQVMLG